jgi:hypothetical protein
MNRMGRPKNYAENWGSRMDRTSRTVKPHILKTGGATGPLPPPLNRIKDLRSYRHLEGRSSAQNSVAPAG